MSTLKTLFPAKETGARLLMLAALLGLWFLAAAAHQRNAVAEIGSSLTAVNSYKTAQVAAWRATHIREAERLSRHPFLGGILAEEIAAPGSRRAQLRAWAKDYITQERYAAMAFLSEKNAVIAATPGYAAGTEKPFLEAFAKAARGTPQLTDLYLAADGRPRMAMLSPLFAGGDSVNKPVCVLATVIDPDAEFYPLLKAVPLLVTSAETLLVRKEGAKALYLNELDFRKNSALKLTLPLSDMRLPAAAALRGRTGFFEGVDYRGVKVFSAIAYIEDLKWAVVTKIDRDKLLAPVRTREYFGLALLLLAAGLVYAGLWATSAARRRAEAAALEKTRQLLAETEKTGRIGGWEIDAETRTQTWTDEMFRILEMDPGKGAPKVPVGMGFIAPASLAQAELAVRRALEAGEPYDQEWEVITAKGNKRWVHAVSQIQREQGRVRRAAGSFQDITERKLAEGKLRDSEARYRSLFGNMLNGLAYCRMLYDGDRPVDFVYLEVNQAFEKLTGLTNVIGKKVTELIPGVRESDSALFELYGRVARGGPSETLELRLEALNMWLHISVYSPARDCFVAIFEVITERKLAELERNRLNRELAAQKEDMEDFLHITTHDLRGPLINIQGFSQELDNYHKELRETAAPAPRPGEPKSRTFELMSESIPQALRIIGSSATRMGEMLNVLLKMSRLGRMPLRYEPVDMDATLKMALTSLSYQLERTGGAVTAGPLPPCTGDPGILSQLFFNLLDNAIKYRNRGRKLEITVSGERKDEKTALYTVSDNGLGIKEADLAKIWRLFYRGHARQPGVEKGEGIGLTMIKRMVERSGGSIRVESKEGAGTKFFVELPA
ncbi:MAG: ATP-binding protein [Elusimicrobia bacterium]|nr:ATP-binding protein [Elusimicrobiota bacterium]